MNKENLSLNFLNQMTEEDLRGLSKKAKTELIRVIEFNFMGFEEETIPYYFICNDKKLCDRIEETYILLKECLE